MASTQLPKSALSLDILGKCTTTKARVCKMQLPHALVDTPVFMPVGTQGAMKGITVEQLEDMDCRIILGNTYHLGHRPGPQTLQQVIEHSRLLLKAGGLHNFMKWDRAILTDSGGFQMVSLAKLSQVTEEGVSFVSPHDSSQMLLTPEHSVGIQRAIGGDIMMQLDDVVHSLTTGPRVEEAMHRSVRWLDRCIAAHDRPDRQNLFAIIQGGLNVDLRRRCAAEMTQRAVPGFAIGGLSGGEEKDQFWRMVTLTTDLLPQDKPRYLMGVGAPLDLVVCVALGVDMFDCVFPTRTGRFGTALVPSGALNLRLNEFAGDFSPIEEGCPCVACRWEGGYTRAQLHAAVGVEPAVSSLISLHNLHYLLRMMGEVRQAVLEQRYPDFVRDFMRKQFPERNYPQWAVDALTSVGVTLV